jgi:hypothetical protein
MPLQLEAVCCAASAADAYGRRPGGVACTPLKSKCPLDETDEGPGHMVYDLRSGIVEHKRVRGIAVEERSRDRGREENVTKVPQRQVVSAGAISGVTLAGPGADERQLVQRHLCHQGVVIHE